MNKVKGKPHIFSTPDGWELHDCVKNEKWYSTSFRNLLEDWQEEQKLMEKCES